MNEDEFISHAEWAEIELIWGKSHYNWGWAFVNPPPIDEEELEQYAGLFGFDS